MAAPLASAIPARSTTRSSTRSRTTSWSRSPCCRATATSRAGSARTRARQLSRLAAAGGGLRAARQHPRGHHHGANRHRPRRKAGVPARHLAVQQGNRRYRACEPEPGAVPRPLRRGVQGPQAVAGDRGGNRRRHLRLVRRLDLREEPALLRGHHDGAEAGRRHHRRPRARGVRRQHYHRPHQPGRQHSQDVACWRVSRRAADPGQGLQQLRRPARQPRNHDARHLRQHSHSQRDGAGRGRAASPAICRPASSCRSTTRR